MKLYFVLLIFLFVLFLQGQPVKKERRHQWSESIKRETSPFNLNKEEKISDVLKSLKSMKNKRLNNNMRKRQESDPHNINKYKVNGSNNKVKSNLFEYLDRIDTEINYKLKNKINKESNTVEEHDEEKEIIEKIKNKNLKD